MHLEMRNCSAEDNVNTWVGIWREDIYLVIKKPFVKATLRIQTKSYSNSKNQVSATFTSDF